MEMHCISFFAYLGLQEFFFFGLSLDIQYA